MAVEGARAPLGDRFIINERGLCEFGDIDLRSGKDWPGTGVFFPLGPTVAVLGFLHWLFGD